MVISQERITQSIQLEKDPQVIAELEQMRSGDKCYSQLSNAARDALWATLLQPGEI